MTQEPQTDAPEVTAAESSADAAASASATDALQAEIAALKDQVLRTAAETENVRRRLTQQAEERGKYAVSSFAKDVLPIADNLRRALDSIPADARESDPTAQKLVEGVELTERVLLAALERHGIRKITAIGEKFDPHHHQAMMEVEDPSKPSGTVVFEMQAGYTLHGRLLREAMVGVSKGGPKAAPAPEGLDTTA